MKVVPKRKWRYPLSLEREYSKYLVSYVEKNMDIVKQFLPDMEELLLVYGLQADAHVHMEVLLDRIHKAMVPPEKMRPVANAMSIRVDRYNQQEWDAIIKSVLGMPMSANGRIHQDSEADDALRELWVAENLDLIKSVDQQTMERIKQSLQEKIVSNVNRRELVKDLTEDVERITGLERNRAILIARDQVGKLNGRLMQYRQTHAGITEYKWSTSGDRRVRASHVALNGKTFTWGPEHPAPEGPPGTPIRCRCVALPVIDLDKVVTKPVPGSYVSIPEYTKPIESVEPSITETLGEGTTDNMKALFAAGRDGKAYKINNNFKKPFAFDPSERKVIINPTHKEFGQYDLPEAITHETIHWLDNFMGWHRLLGGQLDKAIHEAGEFVLSADNVSKYEIYLEGIFRNHMSVSDIFSNITLNRLYGNPGHPDDYWASEANRRFDLIADLLTVYTTDDELAEALILGITPLADIYKELVRRYVKVIRRYRAPNKRG